MIAVWIVVGYPLLIVVMCGGMAKISRMNARSDRVSVDTYAAGIQLEELEEMFCLS